MTTACFDSIEDLCDQMVVMEPKDWLVIAEHALGYLSEDGWEITIIGGDSVPELPAIRHFIGIECTKTQRLGE